METIMTVFFEKKMECFNTLVISKRNGKHENRH